MKKLTPNLENKGFRRTHTRTRKHIIGLRIVEPHGWQDRL